MKNTNFQLLYNFKRWHLGVKRWHFEQKGDTLKFSLKFQKNENFIGILRWIKISQRCHLFDEKHKSSVIIHFLKGYLLCQKVTLRAKRWHFEIYLQISKVWKFHGDTEVDKNFPKVSPFRRKIHIFSYYTMVSPLCQKVTIRTKRWHFEIFLFLSKGDTSSKKVTIWNSPFRFQNWILFFWRLTLMPVHHTPSSKI